MELPKKACCYPGNTAETFSGFWLHLKGLQGYCESEQAASIMWCLLEDNEERRLLPFFFFFGADRLLYLAVVLVYGRVGACTGK